MTATSTKSHLKDELIALEKAYLDAVQGKDGEAAMRLTAPEAFVVSGSGAMKVGPKDIQRMILEHDDKRRYKLQEDTVQVLEVSDDVAIISYKLQTTPPGGGASTDAFDSDVWVRRGGEWLCALHAEVPAASER